MRYAIKAYYMVVRIDNDVTEHLATFEGHQGEKQAREYIKEKQKDYRMNKKINAMNMASK